MRMIMDDGNWDSWDFVGGFWGFVVGVLVGRVFMATCGWLGFLLLPLRLFRGAGLSSPLGVT